MSTIETVVTTAQLLQKRREGWIKVLEAVPMPKAKIVKFPYESMSAAVKDGFKLFEGGEQEAFALLVKGYNTREWRKAAERNRENRDLLADGEVSKQAAERITKRAARKAKQAEAAAATV